MTTYQKHMLSDLLESLITALRVIAPDDGASHYVYEFERIANNFLDALEVPDTKEATNEENNSTNSVK